MMRRPAAKFDTSNQGSRLISVTRRFFFILYIFMWSFICFGVRILRMLFSKTVIAGLYTFSRQQKKSQLSREVSSDQPKDQIVVISKQNGD